MSSIRFWTVSRGATILARFPGAEDGDMGDRMLQLAQKSLERIPPGDVKRSYKVDTEAERLIINFTSTQDIIILTITDINFPQSIAFSSMENVNEKVWKYFGAVVHSTVAMGLDLQLSAALSNEMKRANNPDKLAEVQEQVDDLKKIMIENIEAIMTRGELLEILMIDINELIEEAEDFRRNAQEIQAAMRYVQYLYLITGHSVLERGFEGLKTYQAPEST